MKEEKMLSLMKYVVKKEKTLRSLYIDFQKETKDKKTSFLKFAIFMYNQCLMKYQH